MAGFWDNRLNEGSGIWGFGRGFKEGWEGGDPLNRFVPGVVSGFREGFNPTPPSQRSKAARKPASNNGSGAGEAAQDLARKVNAMARAAASGMQRKQGPQMEDNPLPSFMDALTQAQSMLGGQSQGQGQGYMELSAPSWDPMRERAQGRFSESDAKIQAMYDHLQNQVRTDDAQAIQDNFQQARGDVAADTQNAAGIMQDASASANSQNAETLKALGLDQAAADIIDKGQDANSAVAQDVADSAALGQSAQSALAEKQQASLDANTQMAGVYGLQGAEARDQLRYQLADLLAGYDMDEQSAQFQVDQENSSRANQAQQNSMSQMMGLAGQLNNDAWKSREYSDSLAQSLMENRSSQMQSQQERAAQQQSQQQAYQMLEQLLTSEDQGGRGFSLDEAGAYGGALSGFRKWLQ